MSFISSPVSNFHWRNLQSHCWKLLDLDSGCSSAGRPMAGWTNSSLTLRKVVRTQALSTSSHGSWHGDFATIQEDWGPSLCFLAMSARKKRSTRQCLITYFYGHVTLQNTMARNGWLAGMKPNSWVGFQRALEKAFYSGLWRHSCS